MLPVLRIKLLGTFSLDYGDELVPGVDTPRLQSLLTYLLLHADAPQQRQYLAYRFWPDSTEKQARTNLRQLLHHLRQALPDADRFIETGTHTLQWRPDVPFTLDVAAFGQSLARADRADEQDDPDARQKDPLRETAYRTLMRLHALRNDQASALRVYHECATVLERELSVEPGPATRELYERLLNMQAPAESQVV